MALFGSALFASIGNLLVVLILMAGLWFVSTRKKDASIVDIAWGPACAAPAVLTWLRLEEPGARGWLLTALVIIWATRLALHIGQRNLGHGEDPRYQAMRARHESEEDFNRWSLTRIFLLQGAIAWFVALPVQWGQYGGGGLGFASGVGLSLFALGMFFEMMGDWQLRQFKQNPENHGKLMTAGLWSWTRHPNYFGDACVWIGLTLIALDSPLGWLTILSPVAMIYLLLNVSGKALTEKVMAAKYEDYEAYKLRTSGFIPWPPPQTY